MGDKQLPASILESWSGKKAGPRVTTAVKHSRFVARIKTLLILLVIVLGTMLIIWPMLNPVEKHMKLTFSTITSNEMGMPQMLNPQFQGVDNKNQPYHIMADIAVQETDDNVRLSQVRGDIALEDKNGVHITADGGNILLPKKFLKLYGAVRMVSNDGFEINTESAAIQLKEKIVQGDAQVQVEGPPGRLNASGFLLDGNENTLRFYGPVKMIVYPSHLQGTQE